MAWEGSRWAPRPSTLRGYGDALPRVGLDRDREGGDERGTGGEVAARRGAALEAGTLLGAELGDALGGLLRALLALSLGAAVLRLVDAGAE